MVLRLMQDSDLTMIFAFILDHTAELANRGNS